MSTRPEAMSDNDVVALLLDQHELTVSEICAVLQLPQSTVSRHLKTLSDAGWVTSRRDGTRAVSSPPHRMTVPCPPGISASRGAPSDIESAVAPVPAPLPVSQPSPRPSRCRPRPTA